MRIFQRIPTPVLKWKNNYPAAIAFTAGAACHAYTYHTAVTTGGTSREARGLGWGLLGVIVLSYRGIATPLVRRLTRRKK